MNGPRWLILILVGAIVPAGWLIIMGHRTFSPASKAVQIPARLLRQPTARQVTRARVDHSSSVLAEIRVAPPAAWEANWRHFLDQPVAPERDAALASALKELTATDPEAATEALLALHPTDRVAVVAATLADAARQKPDDAIREAIRFCDEDPAYSLEYGSSLISILSGTGDYRSALNFVLAEDSAGWLGENGSKWMNGLFDTWSKAAPEQAAQAALLVDPGLRGEVLQTVAGSWAKIDPLALANFVWQLPDDPERGFMLDVALRSWADDDPAAASDWMDHREASPEFDAGGAALAARLAGDDQRPEAAVRWAANIFDPKLRVSTLSMVMRYWAATDKPAAINYVMSSAGLRQEERTLLLTELTQPRAVY